MIVRLKDVVMTNARALPETTDPDFTFRYIDISAVSQGRIEVPDEEVRFEAAPSRARRLAQPGDTVVSTVRTYLRAIARVPEAAEPLVFSTGFAVLSPNRSRIDDRFLSYYCTSAEFVDSIVARSVGVSYPAINASEVADSNLDLPPLDEQRRIADFLDTETTRLDGILARRRAQLALLPARWRSSLDETMAALIRDHGAVPLGRRLASIEQGTSPQCDNVPAAEGEWGVLKAGAVKGDRFLPDENKRLPESLVPEVRYEIRAGDLLVTRANTPALVGAAAVVPEGVRARLILCDKIFRLRLSSTLQPQFVALLSQASMIRDARASSATGASSSMVNLSNRDVRSWPIPAAPPEVQSSTIDALLVARDAQYRLESALVTQMTLLGERRQALITAAVTGQFDVSTAQGGAA